MTTLRRGRARAPSSPGRARPGWLTGPLLAAGLLASGPAMAGDLAIVDVKVYPSPTAAPVEHGVILVHDDHISAVGRVGTLRPPPGAVVVDGRGKVATAGFWNSHVHIFVPDLLQADQRTAPALSATLGAMLNRWGFTTVFDLGSILDNTNVLRGRIRQGEVAGPEILTVGEPFYPPGGVPTFVRQFLQAEHLRLVETTSAPEAVAQARRQIRNGADGVKVYAGEQVDAQSPVVLMPRPIARALVAEAHRAGKPAFAHPSNLEGVAVAVDSGVDVLAHTVPTGGAWTPALIGKMRARHMALIPTLTLFDEEAKRAKLDPALAAATLARAVQQLHDFRAAGGEVLFGTDVGYTAAFDTTEEYRLMSRAGLDWRAILASLTTAPASRFGYAARKGRIAPGLEADLVLLDADPATDVAAFAQVAGTLRAGRWIFRAGGQAAP